MGRINKDSKIIPYYDDERKIDFFTYCPICGFPVIPIGEYVLNEDNNSGDKFFTSICDRCSIDFYKVEEMTKKEFKYCNDNELFGETFCLDCYPEFLKAVKKNKK